MLVYAIGLFVMPLLGRERAFLYRPGLELVVAAEGLLFVATAATARVQLGRDGLYGQLCRKFRGTLCRPVRSLTATLDCNSESLSS